MSRLTLKSREYHILSINASLCLSSWTGDIQLDKTDWPLLIQDWCIYYDYLGSYKNVYYLSSSCLSHIKAQRTSLQNPPKQWKADIGKGSRTIRQEEKL